MFALGVAIYLAVIVVLEIAGRRSGYTPIPAEDNDRALWAMQRERVDGSGADAVVLVGNSRMMRSFSSDAFKRELPDGEYAQLALLGAQPGAVIRDLLLDEHFRGILVCGISEGDPFWDPTPQAAYVSYFHERWGWNERWNARIRFFVNEHLVSVLTQMNPVWRLFLWLQGDQLPGPLYTRFARDRTNLIDFTLPAWSAVIPRRQKEGAWYLKSATNSVALERRAQDWIENALALEPLIRAFQARGGRMVYLRLPSSNTADPDGRLRQTLKEAYWDGFAARTAAVAIHFLDVPEIRGLETPDSSHIDSRDAPAFTRAIISQLHRRGVIEPGRERSHRRPARPAAHPWGA